MQLKRLELAGFKSFARKSVLHFTRPTTAVVGPNGSGKSNIVEAFRFVLGEQSIKAMRGKKGEDLIFNGAEGVSRSNRGSVKIVLDNSERKLNVDFDEVVIDRTVYRDGVNEYHLNDSKVRLKDILELLSGIHIGVSNHHIISQGEADRILNAKPEERKEMIEDALGLKVYQYKRREGERKLAKTTENLREVSLLRKELAPRIQFLKKQVEKIERANKLTSDLTGRYLEYFRRENVYLEARKREAENGIAQATEKLRGVEEELEKIKQSFDKSGEEDEKRSRLLSLEAEIQERRAEGSALSREIGTIEGQLISLEGMQQSRVVPDHRAIPFGEMEQMAQRVDEKVSGVEEVQDSGELRSTVFFLRDQVRGIVERFRGAGSEDDDKQYEKIEELKREKESKEKVVEEKREQERQLMETYKELQQRIEGDKEKDREGEREMFRLSALRKDIQTEIDHFRNVEDRHRRDNATFRQDLSEAGALIGSAILGYKETALKKDDGIELTDEEIAAEERGAQEDRKREIERLKIRLEELGVSSSRDEIMKEYRDTTERDEFLKKEIEDLTNSEHSIRTLISDLDSTLEKKFSEGMELIDVQFKEFFTTMFGGGSASVKRVTVRKRGGGDETEEGEESDQETKEGVEVSVSLPQKKIKGLMMLSGGERALTSIALTFAISQVNPPPFLVLDETDAALDEANSKRYADMIERLSERSQLVVITHNRETMSRAGVLYGVTMGGEGISRLLSIELQEAEEVTNG